MNFTVQSNIEERWMEIKATHICFEVNSYQTAMNFYSTLLGAADFKKSWGDDKTYTGFVNGVFTVVIGATTPRRVTKEAPTGQEFVVTDHVGFYVPTTSDVDAIEGIMKKAGYAPLFPAKEYPEFGPGFYSVTFSDVDNNVIEFSTRPGI